MGYNLGIHRRMYIVLHYIKNILYKKISRCARYDPLNNILICSDPRGGSTWLSEIIETIPKSTVLWEPLYHGEDGLTCFKNLKFGLRQYIPESEKWIEAEKAFKDVLSGQELNWWVCRQTDPIKLLTSKILIIKFVRANALLPWLTHTFQFKYAPVLFLRHPFAVVASQSKFGAWDNREHEQYEIPEIPFNVIYTEHKKFLDTLTTQEEALTARWCIANRIPLNDNRNNIEWIIMFYEDLILDPKKELNRLFDKWKIALPEGALDVINRPSSMTIDASAIGNNEKQLSKWKTQLNEHQIEKMQRVLDYFEITVYSKNDIYPKKVVEVK
jgi:hypothetical protein